MPRVMLTLLARAAWVIHTAIIRSSMRVPIPLPSKRDSEVLEADRYYEFEGPGTVNKIRGVGASKRGGDHVGGEACGFAPSGMEVA